MDWLSLYDTHIYYTDQIITLKHLECQERILILLETVDGSRRGGMLCSLETTAEEIDIAPIVRDFADIFKPMH